MALRLLVFTLNLALLVRTMFSTFDQREKKEGKSRFNFVYSDWEINRLGYEHIYRFIILSWAIAGLLCLSIGIYLVSSAIASVSRHRPRKPAHLPGKLWWSMIILAFCAMWTFIGWFIYHTILVRDRAPVSNRAKEWSLGQILAVATWMPFIVEFAYMWWEEPEKGLSGRLIDPYEVVRVLETTESSELEQTGGDPASARLLHRTTI
jgi:hypothetical protein